MEAGVLHLFGVRESLSTAARHGYLFAARDLCGLRYRSAIYAVLGVPDAVHAQ